MFDVGFAELLIIFVLGLVILGPERLPKAAVSVGRFLGKIRRTFTNMQTEIEREVRMKELAEKLQDPHFQFDQNNDDDWANKVRADSQTSHDPEDHHGTHSHDEAHGHYSEHDAHPTSETHSEASTANEKENNKN